MAVDLKKVFISGLLMLIGYSAAAAQPQTTSLLSPTVPFKCPPNAMCAQPIHPLAPIQPDADNKNEVGSGISGRGWASPGRIADMNEAGLAKYKDEPLAGAPTGPLSTKFVVEHRSALNGQRVTIHGVVVNFLKGGCPANPAMMMACMLPRLTIADTAGADRQQRYDVQVMLPMDNKTIYEQGQIVDITGTIAGDSQSVTLTKN